MKLYNWLWGDTWFSLITWTVVRLLSSQQFLRVNLKRPGNLFGAETETVSPGNVHIKNARKMIMPTDMLGRGPLLCSSQLYLCSSVWTQTCILFPLSPKFLDYRICHHYLLSTNFNVWQKRHFYNVFILINYDWGVPK